MRKNIIIILLSIVLISFISCSEKTTNSQDPPGITPNTPPTCSITSPGDGDIVVIGELNISVEAFDDDGEIEHVAIYIDEELVSYSFRPPYNYSDTTFWKTESQHTIRAVATDNESAINEHEILINHRLFIPVNPNPDTIYVPGNFASIQNAIDFAQDGDVILIAEGTYNEDFRVNHPLIIIGSGYETYFYGYTINIESDYVIAKNFRTHGSYEEPHRRPSGISIINSTYVLIDSISAAGCPGDVTFPFPEWPEFPMCEDGSSGISVWNSNNIIIQNSYFVSGEGESHNCPGYGGPGAATSNSINVFFVNSEINGRDAGDGVKAINNSLVALRICEVQGVGPFITDETSSIIVNP